MKVLIVDDDPDIREILLAFLHGEGFQVQGASDGEEALQVLAQEDGWVVFLDWMMPRVDGQAVLCALQATPHLRTANRFILMSATSRWRLEDARLAAGVFVGVLPKPFDLEEVVALLQRLGPAALPYATPTSDEHRRWPLADTEAPVPGAHSEPDAGGVTPHQRGLATFCHE